MADPYCYWDASSSFDVYGPYVNNYYGPQSKANDAAGRATEQSLDLSSPGTCGTCEEEVSSNYELAA